MAALEPIPEDIAAIRELNEQYITAARTNDVDWFDAHMADDVIVILASGVRLNKPEFLATMIGQPRRYRALAARNVTVRVFGPTVQVDADTRYELADGRAGASRYIDTYAWIDCRWQVISAHITSVITP